MKRLIAAFCLLLLVAASVTAQGPTPTPSASPVVQIFRDQAWQFAGFVVGLLALIASIILYFQQRHRKELVYDTLTFTSVFGVDDEVLDRVRIPTSLMEMIDLHLVQLKLTNTGNTPILPADYVEPLTIAFPIGAKIVESTIYNVEPSDIQTAVLQDDFPNAVHLKPTLLNPGDSVVLKFLVDTPREDFAVRGRIVGVKGIKRRQRGRRIRFNYKVLPNTIAVMASLLAILVLIDPNVQSYTKQSRWMIAAILLVISLGIASLLEIVPNDNARR